MNSNGTNLQGPVMGKVDPVNIARNISGLGESTLGPQTHGAMCQLCNPGGNPRTRSLCARRYGSVDMPRCSARVQDKGAQGQLELEHGVRCLTFLPSVCFVSALVSSAHHCCN